MYLAEKEKKALQVSQEKRVLLEERKADIQRVINQKKAEREEDILEEKRVLLEQIQMEQQKQEREQTHL